MSVACLNCGLRRKPYFRKFSEEELRFISAAKVGHVKVAAKADIGMPDGQVATLYSGWAFRYKRTADGARQILDFLMPGDLIGIENLAAGASEYAVEALTPVSLCVLKENTLALLIRQFPDYAMQFVRNLLHDRRYGDGRLLAVGTGHGAQRVAYLMVEIYERQKQRELATDAWCPFPLQRQHIADALGLSGTHVNRAVADLRKADLAQISNSALVVSDWDKLAGFARYSFARHAGKRALL